MAENKVFTGIVTAEQGPIVFQGEDKKLCVQIYGHSSD